MNLKKSVLCLSMLSLSATALIHMNASANEPLTPTTTTTNATKIAPSDIDAYVSELYGQIDFGRGDKVAEEVFNKAMRGYLNLKAAGKLSDSREILSVADFTRSSTQNRLWVIDLKNKKVLYNTYVAHGQGSGMDVPTVFSNEDGTHASSIGFYVTDDTYVGKHGNSLRLSGMDRGYNDAALARGIVVHAADYVSTSNIQGQGRLGRSWGCPAVSPTLAQPIINTIKGGTCLFIYYPAKDYLKTAYWLNKKIDAVPGAPAQQGMPTVADMEKLAAKTGADTNTNRL